MVVIRLSRGGAKKRPFYRVIATDKRSRRDVGDCLERLGYFNPIASGQELRLFLKRDRIVHWMERGAKLSHRMVALVEEWDRTAT